MLHLCPVPRQVSLSCCKINGFAEPVGTRGGAQWTLPRLRSYVLLHASPSLPRFDHQIEIQHSRGNGATFTDAHPVARIHVAASAVAARLAAAVIILTNAAQHACGSRRQALHGYQSARQCVTGQVTVAHVPSNPRMKYTMPHLLVMALVALMPMSHGVAGAKAEELARSIRIARAEFRQASLQEGVEYLQRKINEQLPPGETLKLSSRAAEGRCSFELVDKSLIDVLQEMSRQTGYSIKFEENGMYFALSEVAAVPRKQRVYETWNVLEKIIRHSFPPDEHDPERTAVCFVEINEKDPSDKFLSRFDRWHIPVKKASDAEFKPRLGAADRVTGQFGGFISLRDVKWVDDTKVEFDANYSGSGRRYQLTHTVNGWVITSAEMTWIE